MSNSGGRRGRGTVAEQRARQRSIQDFVSTAGNRTVEEIAEEVGVSTMTVYRDLAELESGGHLRLARGVVTAAASNVHEASSRHRATQQLASKRALARAALEFIEPGSAVMMDDSSTGLCLAELLPQRLPLTVVTNYQALARELEQESEIRLILTGGEYTAWADAVMGPMTVKAIQGLRADVAVMSASSIHDAECFHPTEPPAEVKRAMLAASRFKVLYVDHTKFTRSALHLVAPVSAFDVVIVDAETPPAQVESLKVLGVRVVVAR